MKFGLLTTLLVSTLAGCGRSSHHHAERRGEVQPAPDSQPAPGSQPAPTPGAEPQAKDFDYTYVFRVQEAASKTALFGILPTDGQRLEFRELSGPAFLGSARTGIVDDQSLGKLAFSADAKAELLAKFPAASVIVFSNYDGTLCDDESHQLRAASTLADGRAIAFTFTYAGRADAAGDCISHVEAVAAAY